MLAGGCDNLLHPLVIVQASCRYQVLQRLLETAFGLGLAQGHGHGMQPDRLVAEILRLITRGRQQCLVLQKAAVLAVAQLDHARHHQRLGDGPAVVGFHEPVKHQPLMHGVLVAQADCIARLK